MTPTYWTYLLYLAIRVSIALAGTTVVLLILQVVLS